MNTTKCRKLEPLLTRDGDTGRLLTQFCGRCYRDLEATANGFRHLDSTKDHESTDEGRALMTAQITEIHRPDCKQPGFRYAATLRATKANKASGTAGKVLLICKGCSTTRIV